MNLVKSRILNADRFAITEGYHPWDAFFYILEGSFELTVNGETRIITKNELVFFPRTMPFKRNIISPITYYNVRITDTDDLPQGYVKVKDHQRLLSSLQYMTKLSDFLGDVQEMKDHYLKDIFMQLDTERTIASPLDNHTVSRAKEFMEHNLPNKISLDDIASSASVSVTCLIQNFKRSTGITPIKYLSLLRLAKAEQLLCTTNDSVSEIATACGYENSFYLSNAFKKEYNLSPKNYRQKYKV